MGDEADTKFEMRETDNPDGDSQKLRMSHDSNLL